MLFSNRFIYNFFSSIIAKCLSSKKCSDSSFYTYVSMAYENHIKETLDSTKSVKNGIGVYNTLND